MTSPLENHRHIEPPKRTATGHEKPLASAVKNGYTFWLDLTDGTEIKGVVTAFDKYTITIKQDCFTYPRTFFKHVIKSFTRAD